MGSTGPAVARAPLGEQARDAVRERVIDGRYPQGSRLVEREIAEELAMSRVPVREALRSLVTEGLLELLPHSGVRVRRLERSDVEQLYEVWEPLAVQASRLAARRVAEHAPQDPPGLDALRTALRRADDAAAVGGGKPEVTANVSFHQRIVTLSGNRLLERTMEPLVWQLRLLFGLNTEPQHMRDQHHRMYADITSGEEETAAACTLLHVRDSRRAALRSLPHG
ncbi:GntR family transcriptional regulator [Streptomyces sp. HNM0574]|uniref:GntR family transcriptional regulator n=1 Tax=Streptomyces sp. HNM0574 TaxID=2714954 RepID=UPI003216CC4F